MDLDPDYARRSDSVNIELREMVVADSGWWRRVIGRQGALFSGMEWGLASDVAAELERNHYLGATTRGWSYRDEFGCLVLARPTSRRLPSHWLELTRWCLVGTKNGGTRQWSRVRKGIPDRWPDCTTVVSYSDPSQGHTGALYRACGWKWAPTWHRIVTPPTGNGSWADGVQQAAKDRWVFPISDDPDRMAVLSMDETYLRRFPWCAYSDERGGDYKAFIASGSAR